MTGPEGLAPQLSSGRAFATRAGASVIDQVLSTATNLGVTLIAAQAFDVEAFGRFGVVYLIAVAVGGCVRSSVGATTLIFQQDAAREWAAKPFGAALAVGLGSSGLILVAAAVLSGDLRYPLVALAVVLPGMLVQDTGRLLEFSALRPGRALVLDVIWSVALIVGIVCVTAFASLTPTNLVLVWGGSGTVSGVWSLWAHGRRIPPPSTVWFRRSWDFAWRYLVGFASTLGVFYVTTLLLGVVSGVAAVAAVRATQVLYGPIQNLATGLMVAFVPETAPGTSLRAQRGRILSASGVLAAVAVGITVVALTVPDSIGEVVLGETWTDARPLVLPAGVAAALFGLTSGAVIGLRAKRAVHESLMIGLKISAFQFLIPLGGALLADETGYMWALTGTWVLSAWLWWRCYLELEDGDVAITAR